MRPYFTILPMIFICAALLPSSGASPANPASTGVLLVANKGDRDLGIIDPQSGTQVATVAENGNTGHEVIASPDGRTAYVPIYGDSGVGKPGSDGANLVVIDIASRKVIGNIDFGHGVRPHCPLFGPKDGLLYVSTELENSITVIDPHSLKIVGSIPTGRPESHMFALSRDGRYGYTTNVGSGTISVLDIAARKTLDVIPVAPVIQRIALSVDDRLAFTSDQSKPQLAVFDTATRKVTSWIPLAAPGYGTAATPDGMWLVIAIPKAKQVAILNLKSMKIEHSIDAPAAPQEVVIRPDGAIAYVSCDASHKVAAIRTSDWTVEKLIDAGAGADGLAWAAQK
ncbi:MAG TPA: cytochrome D1 domain-containing protein [Candidatus Binatus sp.]|jgi:DNA-binding beta-propeller fold protein YncE|nr:cytochrome D1 domain-containing protein [Candidatus Binatus sp.]